MIEAKDVAELGRRMRQAQKRYFTTREPGELKEAKRLEAEFDEMVEAVLQTKAPAAARSLFDPREGHGT